MLLETQRLKSWAMKKMAKEKEKRTQPYASSPSFKKDFTLSEEKKQKPTPRRSRRSKTVGRNPDAERAAVLPAGSPNVPRVRKTTRKENKSPIFKKTFGFFFLFIVLQEPFCLSGISQCLLQGSEQLFFQLIPLGDFPLLRDNLSRFLFDLGNNLSGQVRAQNQREGPQEFR